MLAPGLPGAVYADCCRTWRLTALVTPIFASSSASLLILGLALVGSVAPLIIAFLCRRCGIGLVVRENAILSFLALTALKETAWWIMFPRAILSGFAFPSEMQFAYLRISGIAILTPVTGFGSVAAFTFISVAFLSIL